MIRGLSPADLVLTPMGLRFQERVFPCSIGRSGVSTDKREGDGATPSGIHHILGGWYRPDRLQLRRPAPWLKPIGPADFWSDDPRDPAYNHPVRAPHAFSHEAMRRADPLYDLVLITDWNHPKAAAGKGSAIFLHVWRRPHAPTAGCLAFARQDLLWIAARIAPGTRLIIPPAQHVSQL